MRNLFPLRYEKIVSRIQEMRGGKLYNSDFGKRHAGSGEYWDNLIRMFDVYCQKLGLNRGENTEVRSEFKRPSLQSELF